MNTEIIVDTNKYFFVKYTCFLEGNKGQFPMTILIQNIAGEFFTQSFLLEQAKKLHKETDNVIVDFFYEFKNKEDFNRFNQ